MRKVRRLAAVGIVLFLAGCTIRQSVTPLAVAPPETVCVIDNPDVREGFVRELTAAIEDEGYRTEKLEAGSNVTDCPMTVTYTARWSWDLALYMSYAEIRAYEDGGLVGEAVYDSTGGGGRIFDKFIDAEPKIRELVDELFAVRRP
jgi:hypothetical protein